MKKAGLVQASSQLFMACAQQSAKNVSDFAVKLKRLFKTQVMITSRDNMMLQHFLMGLKPSIRRQLLLHGKPKILQQAIATATNVEYALNFETLAEDTQEVNAF